MKSGRMDERIEERANQRAGESKSGRMDEEERANGIRAYTNKTRLRGLKSGRMEFASIQQYGSVNAFCHCERPSCCNRSLYKRSR